MAGVLATLTLNDKSGAAFTQRVWDESGTGAGPFQPVMVIASSAGVVEDLGAKLDTIAADVVSATGVVGAGTAATATRTTLASDDPLVAVVQSEDNASANGDKGIVAFARRTATPANTSGTDGDYESLQLLNGRLYVRGEPRAFAVVGTTLTRPANTTAYTANDSISDNATAASVTAQPVTLSDTNDDPVTLERIRVVTGDTGFAATKNIRVWVYNSDPTASSGVGAGDNVAYSNKKAGFLGTMSGTFRAGHSDGGIAICVPDEGARIISPPGTGAKTVWLQYQTLDAVTPSANSTTFIPTVEGFQVRA